MFLKIYFMLDGLILFRKGDFRLSRVVFKGGMHQFWGNPYLNSTTILFNYKIDNQRMKFCG